MNLTVCLAVFNEEKNIHIPLDSVYDIADEIIIVDGGSTDKTVETAQSYGDKIRIIQTDNPPLFHINKQKSLDAATGKWILQLDADEALSQELKTEIGEILNVAGQDEAFLFSAYWLPRKNFFLTRFLLKGGQYPDYTIRFYRNGAVRFPCKSVHENVELISPKSEVRSQKPDAYSPKPLDYSPLPETRDIMTENSQNEKASGSRLQATEDTSSHGIGYLKNPLLHYADPDFSRYLMRWDRYTTLDADMIDGRLKTVDGSQKPEMPIGFINYFFIKPAVTFFMMYIRHKGFMDGFPGFVFALFSSIRFWLIYIKVWTVQNRQIQS